MQFKRTPNCLTTVASYYTTVTKQLDRDPSSNKISQ